MKEHQIAELVKQSIPTIQQENIRIEQLGGFTNFTYAVHVDHTPLYFLKLFSQMFDREIQNAYSRQLADLKLAPRVIHAEKTYRIDAYLRNTRHPGQQDLESAHLAKRILEHMHRFHQVPITNNQSSFSDYLFSESLQQQLQTLRQCKSMKGNIKAYHSLFESLHSTMRERIALGQQLLPKSKSTLRLCHNDLYNLNILYNQEEVYFIDYDFIGANYLAYDIANFINQLRFDYMVEEYPGFKLCKEFTFDEIGQYARTYPGYYEGLEMDVLRFMCVVNLFWAYWCLRRFHVNKSEAFGRAEHGLSRIHLFQHYLGMLRSINPSQP